MEAKELRIGNLTEQGEVKSFYEHGVHVGFGKCYFFSELNPIPLTEEWLLNFGFEQKFGIMSWELEDVEIVYETLAKFYRLYPRTNPIKYVHQLQNLYFALTGEELKSIFESN